jgi:hypothetical protein
MGGGDVLGLGFRFAEAADGSTQPVGRDGVFQAFTPPYHADMREVVDHFLEIKWASFEDAVPKPYLEPDKVVGAVPRPHEDTVDLVKRCCQYVHDSYGRFPLHLDPMYQRLTVQGQHADPDFYERFYPPGALAEQHLEHSSRWHPTSRGRMAGRPDAAPDPARPGGRGVRSHSTLVALPIRRAP